MQIQTIESVLIAGLSLLLIWGSITDWQRRTIDNWLNATIALAAPAYWFATGLEPWPDIAIQIAVAVVIFGIFAGFFALGAMGGGDVKLLGALALWFQPLVMMRLLIIMSILGGVLTVIMIIRQKMLNLPGKPQIPYGIAITLAALWMIYERYLNHFWAGIAA